VNIPLFWTTW